MCTQQTTACFRASLHYGTFVILVLHIGQDTNKVQKAPLNGYWKLQSRPTTPEGSHGEPSREIWHPTLRRKETAMAIFDETYRVVGVESQRLILRGLDSGEVLTVINADPETPITDEDYPLGKIIRLFDPSTQAPN